MMDIYPVAQLGKDDAMCRAAHECFCACQMSEDTSRWAQEENSAYRNKLHRLVDSGKFEAQDFTVVVQVNFTSKP